MAEKPSVLIIGGLGYIGRFLALYIHQNGLASDVRIVDKVLPQLAWLAPEFDEACAGPKFMQADASRERMVFLPELASIPRPHTLLAAARSPSPLVGAEG
jgi:nucleoside-diphosphate-sugar epimerase